MFTRRKLSYQMPIGDGAPKEWLNIQLKKISPQFDKQEKSDETPQSSQFIFGSSQLRQAPKPADFYQGGCSTKETQPEEEGKKEDYEEIRANLRKVERKY